MLQCVAVWCSVLQYVAECCRVLQCVAVQFKVWRVYVSESVYTRYTHFFTNYTYLRVVMTVDTYIDKYMRTFTELFERVYTLRHYSQIPCWDVHG